MRRILLGILVCVPLLLSGCGDSRVVRARVQVSKF